MYNLATCTGQVSSGMGASVRRGNATLPLLIPFFRKGRADNDEDDDDVDEDIGELVIHPEDVPVPVLPEATQIALRNKLCEGAYVGRNKKQEAALVGLRKMWAKT
jgi:hypothetical protein